VRTLGCRSIRTSAILQERRDDGLRTEMCQSERRAHSKYVRRTTSAAAQRAVCTQFELKAVTSRTVCKSLQNEQTPLNACVCHREGLPGHSAVSQRLQAPAASTLGRGWTSSTAGVRQSQRRCSVPKHAQTARAFKLCGPAVAALHCNARLRACSSLRSQQMQHRSGGKPGNLVWRLESRLQVLMWSCRRESEAHRALAHTCFHTQQL